MDRNTFTAFVLIAIILVALNYINQPPEEAIDESVAESTLTEESAASATENPEVQAAEEVAAPSQLTEYFKSSTKGEQKFTLENDKIKIDFSSQGGRPIKVELKDYLTYDKEPLLLMQESDLNRFDYQFYVDIYQFSSQAYVFQVEQPSQNEIRFKLPTKDGGYMEQRYQLLDDYTVDYDLVFNGFDPLMRNDSEISLVWYDQLSKQERDSKSERGKSTFYYKEKGEPVDNISASKDQDEFLKYGLDWVAFKQPFFSKTIRAEQGFQGAKVKTQAPVDENSEDIKLLASELKFNYVSGEEFHFPMQLELAPLQYSALKKKGDDLEKQVYLGWRLFAWVNKWIIIPMFNFLGKFISNYGIMILILTLVIKLALSPFTYKSYKSMAKMNVLKPELEELKAKHGDDPAKMQQEQMKLYSSMGVSPLGGCLPQLFQMPILIAMYNFFPSALELRQQSFLWAKDLSTYDSILNLPFEIPFYGAHVSGFALLSGVANMLYMRMNSSMSPQNNAQMKMIQTVMPIFLVVIFNKFSAALTFYFFLSSIFTFGQQWVIKKFFIDDEKIREELHANKKKPKKKSRFQKRMEDMLKQQQEAQRQKQKDGKSKGNKKRKK